LIFLWPDRLKLPGKVTAKANLQEILEDGGFTPTLGSPMVIWTIIYFMIIAIEVTVSPPQVKAIN